jgi:hypothetical protein
LLFNLAIAFLAPFPFGMAFLFPLTAAFVLHDAPRTLRTIIAVISLAGLLLLFATALSTWPEVTNP